MKKASVDRWSFSILSLFLVGVVVFKLTTPFLTVLFSALALQKLHLSRGKLLPVVLFILLVSGITYGSVLFVRQAIKALPEIASTSIPIVIEHAKRYGLQLPFDDLESLRPLIIREVTGQVRGLASVAEIATKQFVYIIIAFVIAISIFINSAIDLGRKDYLIKNNFYSALCDSIALRFTRFYESFATVMGAQIIIASVNTFFTAILVYSIGLPYQELAIILTFLCGILPIIGNILSNTIIFCIAVAESLNLAITILLFLIIIHKLEYFLNSRIIGGRIKNPMWLTMLGLLVGERLAGIPGMILAPVILHYIKHEGSLVEVNG